MYQSPMYGSPNGMYYGMEQQRASTEQNQFPQYQMPYQSYQQAPYTLQTQPQYHGQGGMIPAQMPAQMPAGAAIPGMDPGITPQVTQEGLLPLEQSYIENILRFNRGKVARFHMTYENNPEWNARVFTGIIEAAGRDHIIVSSLDGGPNFLLLMVNLDFVEFEDEIEYFPPSLQPQMAPQRSQKESQEQGDN